MKRINYLIVAMLMAFTMVGCQFDPTYLEDKISGLEKSDEKQNERLDGLESRVADIEGKLKDIDFSKFITSDALDNYAKDYAKLSDLFTEEQLNNILANYVTTNTLDNYAKLSDLFTEKQLNEIIKKYLDDNQYAKQSDIVALNDISNAVSDYLNTVTWSNYVNGYTKSEMDEKLETITNITSKLEETYATINKLNELSVTVTSLETTVEELNGKVTSLENKPTTPSGNGGDGYCGLSADEVTNIKTLLTQWANNNISGVVYSLAGYVKETDLADYVKTENLPSLADYAKKTDIKDFTSDIATLTSRITTVENMLKADGTFGQKLAELETKVNNTNTTEVTELKNTVDTIKAWYETNKDKVTNLDLSAYLTSDDLSGYAKTEDIPTIPTDYYTKSEVDTKVKNVADSLAELTSRVETLEDLLDTESDFMKSISTMKLVLGNTESGLVKDFNDLKNAVKENTDKLAYKIGDEDYSIEKLAEKVKALYEVKDAYKSYCDSAVSGLATLTEVNEKLEGYAKTDMTNVDKQTVVNLVEEYVEGEVAKVTVDTSDFLTSDSLSNYATKTDLANKLDVSAIDIENITSRLANLETVEKKHFISDIGGGTYMAWAYYKIGNSGFYIGYEQVKHTVFNGFDDIISKAKINTNAKLVVTTTPILN